MTDETVTDAVIKVETAMEPPKAKRARKPRAAAVQPSALDAALDAALADNVEPMDLTQVEYVSPSQMVVHSLDAAKLTPHIAEVATTTEPDGSIRRVEFRGVPGTTFVVPGAGVGAWVTFTGDLKDFPDFLSSVTVNVTIDG